MAILGGRVISNIIDTIPQGSCTSNSRDIDTTDMIVVHQTDGNCNGEQHIRDVAHMHTTGDRSWCGIGYHIFITEDGKIYQTRNLKHSSAHAGNYNYRSVGVVICGTHRLRDGDKNVDIIPKVQYKALVWTLAHLQNTYPNLKEIVSHAFLQPENRTDPNLHMDELVDDVKKKRIINLIIKWVFLALLVTFIIALGKKVLYY
jgi:N-acetyl-anhydromuramyl-L-alanine amidase AmpD